MTAVFTDFMFMSQFAFIFKGTTHPNHKKHALPLSAERHTPGVFCVFVFNRQTNILAVKGNEIHMNNSFMSVALMKEKSLWV